MNTILDKKDALGAGAQDLLRRQQLQYVATFGKLQL